MANLFKTRFPLIGNIYRSHDLHHSTSQTPSSTLPGNTSFMVDKIVSMPFFWGERLKQNVSRGPFHSSVQWMKSRLAMAMNDCQNILKIQDDEDEVEEAEATKSLILRLSRYMPKVFPPGSEEGPLAIHHDDISEENIIVCTIHGRITALIDWECVSCLPLWKTCQFPVYLWGRDRLEQPQQELYAKTEDGTANEIFTEHLKEFEKTRLRKLFLARMAQTEPQWIQVFESSSRKADFDLTLEHCDSSLMLKTIKKWLDNIDAGKEYQSLRQLTLE
ncbi:hypothetical protein GJ744_008108 [Endocarpon pusillum]|uniref:Aminoglycoside phosphotransferase domain-containing protein n=1 Tax=Endocarpon pusillum TaxID=364733 RepID=A0A8H7AHU3_9EURO|nr:hypothetical protein GJ744_008108 [Endocarpon pusillum]